MDELDELKEKRREDALEAFGELIDIIDKLRSPGGCPWDIKQTPVSLKPYIIEEAYEVLDAIDSGISADIREELGDLLLQIMLQSQIAFENGQFHIGDVVKMISRKMVHRHPHVFGDVSVEDADEVLSNWEKIKAKEKRDNNGDKGLLDGVPSALPGLLMAYRMGSKASRVGFDWSCINDVRSKVLEELKELDEAIAGENRKAIEEEAGDLFFAMAQWARHLKISPEESIRSSCVKFKKRFKKVEQICAKAGKNIEDCNMDEMEAAWQEAKL
jgi:tetrapyrrole methylase family protein/MazG family protein